MLVKSRVKTRPFLKWVGGKTQLLTQLRELFPKSFESYFEPFFGGGAVFFDLAPVTGHINDINKTLMNAYVDIRDNSAKLIKILSAIESEYTSLDLEHQSEYYYDKRAEFNESKHSIKKTALLIFLNKTCFNGLYRENRKGEFNVPFGKHRNPTICDADNLRAISKVLKYVNITNYSYVDAVKDAKKGDFVYLDPPYHPLNATSSFTGYTEGDFTADDQRSLKKLFDELNNRGCYVVMSNSDTEFIRDLYKEYRQEKVWAGRAINAQGHKRGKITELVVLNY